MKLIKLTIFFTILYVVFGKRQIPIGGIFHDENYDTEIAFRSTIDRINIHERNFELVPIVKKISSVDSFIAERTVCDLAAEGVAAVFGPGSILTSAIVSSVCKAIEIPHIITHWSPEQLGRPKNVLNEQPEQRMNTLNIYPETSTLSSALSALLVDYTWKSFTIIYENDEGLMRLQDVLQIHGPDDNPITVRQLPEDNDYRPLFKEIQRSGESHIVLDCSTDKIMEILHQAKEVQMMEEYQSYIITSLDTHTLDFDDLKDSRSNITALRLIDPQSFEVRNAVHDWQQGSKRYEKANYYVSPESVKTEPALMHDGLKLFATAIRELDASQEISVSKINCKHPQAWEYGLRIIEYMKVKSEYGLTGSVILDRQGQRRHFILDIIEKYDNKFKKIGSWDPTKGINYSRTADETASRIVESLQNKTVIVVGKLGAPFCMLKDPEDEHAGYEGYAIDLVDGISKLLNFTYKFEIVPDGNYGSYNKETKSWNGLVRQLLDRKADIAAADLTITYERRTAVDFTMPYMTLGISILYAKPVKQPPNLFSFLSPLSLDVWIYMATAYLGVSVLLFILSRMAPADWENPHPCNQDPEEVENIWDMLNSTWLTMGSIMGQGCDILPKAVSTRLVAGMWWFFALIMLSSYTANLAAFLTMERMDATIESAEDLAKQSKIKYGAVTGGSTAGFFKQSNFSTYQRMWAAMESARPSVFTKTNPEGVERVSKGKRLYAFLMESTPLEYIIERQCDLTQIGGLLDSKGYGIAMPTNSPYRTAISGAVLKMQEEGKLHQLKTKWWKEKHGGGSCTEDAKSSSDSAAELGIGNVGGVFVVLAFGCLTSLIIGCFEFLWNIRKVAVEEKITPWDAFKAELKFATNVWIRTKPVHNRLSRSSSSRSTKSRSKRGASEAMVNAIHAASSAMHLDRLNQYFNNKKNIETP